MPSMHPAVQRLVDLGVVAGITVCIGGVSQRWSGFNSPDSEFYASLALFGSDVTDRAFEPAYTWTRLGYIVPVRGLVAVFGPWAGFEIWRLVLLALVVASIYAVGVITGRSRLLSASLSVFIASNTVVLAFLGNTYLTGTAVSAMFVLLALGVSYLGSTGSNGRGVLGTPRWTTGLMSGLVLGWLIMINPYTFILGAGMWATVRLVALIKLRDERWRRLRTDVIGTVVGSAISISAFLAAGRHIFPRLDWWATYIEWNSRLDYTVFIVDANTWQRDSALLVVVISVIVSITAAVVFPARRWAWAGAAIAVSNVSLTAILMIAFTGPWLEAPTYVAKLWPGALLALTLTFLSAAPGTWESRSSYPWVIGIGAAVTIPLLLWSGRFDGVLSRTSAWLITVLLLAVVMTTLLLARHCWNVWIALLLSAAILTTFVGAQILQNGRGLLGGYGQYPFRSAYVDFDYERQMASKIAIQQWLLNQTSAEDTVALWTDPESLTADVAAMQLWGGYNIFTLDATLNRDSTRRLEEIRPSVIALYAPDHQQIKALFETLPPWALPSDLRCTTEPYLGIGSGKVFTCITRLTWVG